jgi:hypothetical protein
MKRAFALMVEWTWPLAVPLVALQIAVLHAFGQPWIAASGRILFWVNDPFSPDMSQQLADWYSFSHIVHGFVFYGLLRLAAPLSPFGVRLLIAMSVEIGWEITENLPAVIQHYRQQALAAGYVGDSILNSLSDTLMMCTGFFIASRLSVRYVLALALGFELFTLVMIRDDLTLNVINLALPSQWAPMRALHDWQGGAKHQVSGEKGPPFAGGPFLTSIAGRQAERQIVARIVAATDGDNDVLLAVIAIGHG